MEKDKTIKIFLASSNELHDERVAFGNYIRQLDKKTKWLRDRVDVFEWEDYSGAYNGRRKQDEYNDMVRKSDMFLALFFKKAGDYTIEEFNVAIEERRRRQLPMVYVFCKKLKLFQWQTMKLRRFKRRLNVELGYFWIQYDNQDSLQHKFINELLKNEEELDRLKLENGTVTLEGGIHVAELANLPFAARNKDYKQMTKELEEAQDEIKALEEGLKLYPKDRNIPKKLQEKRRHFFQLKKEFEEFQKALFDIAQHIVAMQKEDMSKKMRRATEAFEAGKLNKTNKLIDEIIKKAEENHAIVLLYNETIHQGIAALLMKAKTKMAEVSIPISERVELVQAIYAKADQWAEDSGLPKEKSDEQLWDYANFLYDNVKYKEAESVGLRLIALREELIGKEHPSTADAYHLIGMVYHDQGDYAKALKYYRKALDIRERVLGHDHPDTASSYNNIGVVYDKQGNYAKALEYYEKALDIGKRVLGPDHPYTATSYNNIAGVYYKQGDYAMALNYHGKALDIRERVLGPDHPYTATSYNNIGAVYKEQGDYAKALEYSKKALDICERVLGPDHPYTATSYGNIGVAYKEQGDDAKALEYYRKALDICERVLGPDHPDTALSYNNIGNVYYSQGNYAKALKYHGKALDIRERVLGHDHPSTAISYNNIGNVYNSQGDYDKALEYYKKDLDICERVLGPDHPNTASSYDNIGNVYDKQGDYAKALKYHRKALAIFERVLGPNHSDTKIAMKNMKLCLGKMQMLNLGPSPK